MTDPRCAEQLHLALARALSWIVSIDTEMEGCEVLGIPALPDLHRLLGNSEGM
jgi:hypothetical protein